MHSKVQTAYLHSPPHTESADQVQDTAALDQRRPHNIRSMVHSVPCVEFHFECHLWTACE